jgi:hypothetical protein
VQDPPAVSDTEGELAEHVRARRTVGIGEVVVVAPGDEAAVLDRLDAMQDDEVQRLAVVGDHVSDAVLGLGSHHREVAAVEARSHADAVGGDVAGLPADLRRGQQQPAGDGQHDQRGADEAGAQ